MDIETRVQKWGNSLAVCIPKPIAAQLGLANHSPVKVSLRGTELVISPVKHPDLNLADLLAGVTEDNLHGEIDTGTAVGKEIW